MTRSLPKDNWTEVSPEEMAAFLKTWYTPGRHDLMVVKYGHRVGIIEQAQIGEHLAKPQSMNGRSAHRWTARKSCSSRNRAT
jgi:hypothetical protein